MRFFSNVFLFSLIFHTLIGKAAFYQEQKPLDSGVVLESVDPNNAAAFEIIKVINTTTRSFVYQARNTITGEIVALKQAKVATHYNDLPRFLSREYLVETKSFQMLPHIEMPTWVRVVSSWIKIKPFEVQVIELGEISVEQKLLEMESKGLLAFSEPVVNLMFDVFISALKGINEIHQNGLLHNDIKLSNIMFMFDSKIKLIDFESLSPPNTTDRRGLMGTNGFMPPELIATKVPDSLVDYFAFGVSLAYGLSLQSNASFELSRGKFSFPNGVLHFNFQKFIAFMEEQSINLNEVTGQKLRYLLQFIKASTEEEPLRRREAIGSLMDEFRSKRIPIPVDDIRENIGIESSKTASCPKVVQNLAK